jgi:type VI secretion system protein ImpC
MSSGELNESQSSEVQSTSSNSSSLTAGLAATQKSRDKIRGYVPAAQQDKFDDWWEALIGEVTAQDFKFSGTAMRSVDQRIEEIDQQISRQLREVMHHPEFQKLEGTWRGLQRFVNNTEIQKGELEVHVMNCSKETLAEEFENAGQPHKSEFYKKMVRGTYQVFGGVPFGVVVADYEWSEHPRDVKTLSDFAKVASISHTSILTSPSPALLGKDSFDAIKGLDTQNFADIFERPECIEWRNFRESHESRYVTMAMPRYMARLPYGNGKSNIKVDDFHFEEFELSEDGENQEQPNSKFCWSNAAYALAERVTESFFVWGWTTAIRGVENGGLVRELPLYKYTSARGDTRVHCPTELVLDFEQEFALSNQGMCPLQYYLDKNYAVFAGGQTARKPRKVVEEAAQASENLSARLPYILAVSRVIHFCKAIAHDKVGSFLERTDAEKWLNDWIRQYVDNGANPSDEIKRKKPFKQAKIVVRDKPGDPGFYEVEVLLAPWIQFEGMTANFTMVADVEKAKPAK